VEKSIRICGFEGCYFSMEVVYYQHLIASNMAISINSPEEGKLHIEMDNGHVVALKKIVNDYNLQSEKEALTFLLGLISQANGTPIEINGNKYVPPDSFRRTS
jgi:hypothetical protein